MSLVLFSGLAADDQVFVPQKLMIPELIVPGWLVPAPKETLTSYAGRMSESLRSLPRPLHIGGASFGGILALHMAQFLQPDSIILIGSVRRPAELPRYIRLARPLRACVPYMPLWPGQHWLAPMVMSLTKSVAPRLHGLAAQMRRADPRVIRWSIGQILDWQAAPEVTCPVHHVHGSRDIVLPARYTHPDTVIQGGGHIISLTHPAEVTEYLLALTTGQPRPTGERLSPDASKLGKLTG